MSRRPGWRAIGGLALGFAVAGCLPAPVTSQGREVARLYGTFLLIAALVAIVVLGLAIFAILRYRGAPGDDELPPQVHGNLKFEALWTGIPLVTIVGLLVLTVLVLNSFNDAVRANASVEVRVTGFRWGWRFVYPNDGVVMEGIGAPGPELYVPVGENVRVTMTGEDVIHAFYVPQFLFKKDAIPGHENQFAFTVDEAGRYGGQCAEFCGIYHSRMPFTVVAVPRAEYDEWLAANRGLAPSLATPEPSLVTAAPTQLAPEATGPYESVEPTVQPSVTTSP
ncbi:MAG TPA: cytochrome c oxidase subunit II [Candidatus Limnocylindrales bacterium]|nr:cytochrome c oxidase subunit II [Candidatus Limnocylindrales bacterium]